MRLLLLLLLLSCNTPSDTRKIAIPAFYHWKTVFSPTDWEKQTLQNWNASRLYVRYADIDRRDNKGVIPVASTAFRWEGLGKEVEVVPVFYLVNRIFSGMTEPESQQLAQRILDRIAEETPGDVRIPEIQMDCDWTVSTRDAYFRFLGQLRLLSKSSPRLRDALLSATIRLHQVKYSHKTGIPPADRGLLMLYNFDNPADASVKNSIIDPKTAKDYLGGLQSPYPLPLDAALPLFAWGLHFRGNAFQGFLHEWRADSARNCSFLTQLDQNIFRVKLDTSAAGSYFRRGDWIRTEEASQEALSKVWGMAQRAIQNDTCHLVFFDLNAHNLKYYPDEVFSQIVR